MNREYIAQGFGCLTMMVIIPAILIVIAVVIVSGVTAASAFLLPIFAFVTMIMIAVNLIIILPLSFRKSARRFTGNVMMISSYVFGATVWMEGFILTLSLWGISALIIGVLIAGVGVVPIAMLATLFNKMWGHFLEMLILIVFTFGTRTRAHWLLENAEHYYD